MSALLLLCIGAATTLLFVADYWRPLWATLALLSAVGYALIFRVYWQTFDAMKGRQEENVARAWVEDTNDERERRSRLDSIAMIGAGAALESAGIDHSLYEPTVNIDGTPMIEGAGVDINGNAYGVPRDDMFADMGGTHDFGTDTHEH